MFEQTKKTLITGAHGMVGSCLTEKLKELGYNDLLTPTRHDLDLTDSKQVDKYIYETRPKYVFHLAAVVGGIQFNIDNPVKMLKDNLKININVFESCNKYKIEKMLYLGSSCTYPAECKQPMKEEYLLTGKLEPTNEGYALAKIIGLKLAEYYKKQNGLNVVCLIPPNLYHENKVADSKSHVLEALVKKICEAKINSFSNVIVWGDGESRRELMHADDIADAMLYFIDKNPGLINVGTGTDCSIKELMQMIAEEAEYAGEIVWDKTKPNGMRKKLMNVDKMKGFGFKPKISIREGIKRSIKKYMELSKV